MQSLAEGMVFASRYRVVRCIAAGGMGAVYEVLHLETDRRRALKVMLPHVVASADLRERFKREAKIAAVVESEHLIEIFDAGVDEATDMPFLVMELLKGEELGKRLKRVGRLSPTEALTFLRQTAQALDETHRASIVHRDLKPGNLFISERKDGTARIKVLDFGIAKLIADGTKNAAPTQALGTPLYMAPEQFEMDARVSAASDIYALGMIAYTMLVGIAYWREEHNRGENVYAFAAVAARGPKEAASLRAARAGLTLPPAFDPWFARITAMSPEQRFPTATAAVTALEEVFLTPVSPPSDTEEPPVRSASDIATAVLDPVGPPVAAETVELTPFGSSASASLGNMGADDAATVLRSPKSAPVRRTGVVVAGVTALGLLAALGGSMLYGGRARHDVAATAATPDGSRPSAPPAASPLATFVSAPQSADSTSGRPSAPADQPAPPATTSASSPPVSSAAPIKRPNQRPAPTAEEEIYQRK